MAEDIQQTAGMSSAKAPMSTEGSTVAVAEKPATVNQQIQDTGTQTTAITSHPAKTEIGKVQTAIDTAKAQTVTPTKLADAQIGTQTMMQQRAGVPAGVDPNLTQDAFAGNVQERLKQMQAQVGKQEQAKIARETAKTEPGATPSTTTPPDTTTPTAPPQTTKYVYDQVEGGYVPQTGSPENETSDPGQALIQQQKDLLQKQFNDTQARINQQFDQRRREMENQLQRTKGASAMQLARMGAFSVTASGVAYMNSLDTSHQAALNQLESERQYAISMAENELAEKSIALAWQSLERADELKAQAAKAEKDHLERLIKVQELLDKQEDRADKTISKWASAGMEVPDEMFAQMDSEIGWGSGTAKSVYEIARQDQVLKDLDYQSKLMDFQMKPYELQKTIQDLQTQVIGQTQTIFNTLKNVPAGMPVQIAGQTYYGTQGMGNIEIDAQGIGRMATVNPMTGEIGVVNMGYLGSAKDGWMVKSDDNGVLWRINENTGEYGLVFGQDDVGNTWRDYFPEGSQSPFRNTGDAYQGECAALWNDLYGSRVMGSTLQQKLDTVADYRLDDIMDVQVGDTIIETAGSTGHVAIVEAVEMGPNGKPMIRLFESNMVPPYGKQISHSRTISVDNPKIKAIARVPLQNLPATGTDTTQPRQYMPTFGVKTGDTAKMLTVSEAKALGVPYGTTRGEAASMGLVPGGDTLLRPDIPTQEEFTEQMQKALGMTLTPERAERMYQEQIGVMEPIVDAAEVVSTGMTKAQAEATLKAINKAIDRGDVQGAKEQLKKAAITSLPTAEQTTVRGREIGVQQLTEIEDLLYEYEAAGGDTNIFKGTEEAIAQKVGKVRDKELRKIASQIRTSLIDYRKSVSGAAFTESEMEEYKGLFPSIGNEFDLNLALIDGLISSWELSNEATFRTIMTPSLYEAIYAN